MGTCPVSQFLKIDHCALKSYLKNFETMLFGLFFICLLLNLTFRLVPKTSLLQGLECEFQSKVYLEPLSWLQSL